MSNYYPNRDKLWSGFPTNWSLLKRLMWVRIMRGGSVGPAYETVTGNPVSFTTVRPAPLRKLEVAFSPVQDLHGYDSPWPAGGGKNKYSDVWSEYTKPYEYYVCPITLEQGDWVLSGELTGTAITGCVVGIVKAGTKYSEFVSLRKALNMSREVETHSLAVDSTWTDPHLVIYCTGETQFNSLFSNYHFQLEKSSTASSYAPYSNECPILGWDSLNVEQRGKNVFGGMAFAEALHAVSNVGEISGNTVTFGHSVPVDGNFVRTLFSGFKPNTAYTIRFDYMAPNGKNNSLLVRYTDGGYVPIALEAASRTSYSLVVGPSRSVKDICLSFYSDKTTTLYIDTIGVMEGNNANFVPYNPLSRSISITIGQTVYSGTVDVVTGKGGGDMDSVDMGTLDWNYSNNSGMWPVWLFFAVVPNTVNGFKRLCSIYPLFEGSMGNAPDKSMVLINNKVCYIRDDSYTDAASFKTAMSGVQLVYELAEPFTIQLTPQEVESLAGDNVLFSDANGDLTVEYRSN